MATEDPRAIIVDPDRDASFDDQYDDTDDDADDLSERASRHKRSGLLEWIVVVVVAITSALLVRAYVLQQFAVEGTSMLTTLHPSDRVLVNKLSYRLHDPRRGDVVVLKRNESDPQAPALSRRAVARRGKPIESRACQFFVTAQLRREPYLDPQIV